MKKLILIPLFALCLLSPSTAFALDVGSTTVVDAAPARDAAPRVIVTGPDAIMGTPDAMVDAAVAPKEIMNADDAAAAVSFLILAAESGAWPLFSGVLVLLLIWFLDKILAIKSRVPSRAIPWVAAALGISGSIAAALLAGHVSLASALLQGFIGGLSSVGLWELFFQKKEEPEPAV